MPEAGEIWGWYRETEFQYSVRLQNPEGTEGTWKAIALEDWASRIESSLNHRVGDTVFMCPDFTFAADGMRGEWKRISGTRECMCGERLPDDDSYACSTCVEEMLRA